MPHLNIEIKARTHRLEEIRKILSTLGADFKGVDHQIDTYFNCPNGRMKLREGNIENSLIHYERSNQAGPKDSHVSLFRLEPDPALGKLLSRALGVWKVVDKQREIYFIDNVKFHLDQVRGLGTFVEIEAIDVNGNLDRVYLLKQCQDYLLLLGIGEEDLLEGSYSDMV